MRTDAINWFASSELCRSLQDGGKTPLTLLLTPIPFSNIPPAVLVILIALAYIEEDGLLLCLAFLFAVILISIASAAVWGTIFGALLISDI